MAFNGSGLFVRLFSWVNDAANSINITASRMDSETDGIAAGLSNCITRDGQGKPSAPIDWNAQNLTNVGTFAAANVLSSTYTPVLTGVANVAASTARITGYMRDGNAITVFGSLAVTPTASAGTLTRLGISIPVASVFTQFFQAAGCSKDGAFSANTPGVFKADVANARVEFSFQAADPGLQEWPIHFTYLIL